MVDLRRRALVAALAVSPVAALAAGAARAGAVDGQLRSLELDSGGRLGLAVLDTGSRRTLQHRADERFSMASTFKLLLAGAVLAKVDAGERRLDEVLHYTSADLLAHSPVTAPRVSEGGLSLDLLVRAIVETSDNTAANVLLDWIGGPPALTAFARRIGDPVTRLDRREPALNSNLAGDPRDTTTPAAMVATIERLLLGRALGPASRERLLEAMRRCETGRERLRASLPPGWTAGDKTGTGERGAVNDLAILWPPGRPPILVACYLSDSRRTVTELASLHARIGALVAATFA
ncbi:MAG: class A beta-lactamase [Proteobacteria bacterium]|nr:class A beta-lactamase [Pseudomonadota bacterium]